MRIRIFLFLLILILNSFSGFVVEEFVPDAERFVRIFIMMGDGVMLTLALTTFFRNRSFYGVKYFGVFLLISTITVIYNLDNLGLMAQLNGLRQPLFFFSSLVVVHDIFQSHQKEKFIQYCTLFLLVFAIAQTPTSLLQFVRHGAGDDVGGTFGWGGSGLVTQLLFLICFYFVVKFGSLDNGSSFGVTRALVFTPLLIPCALNSTKITFLLMPLFFVLLLFSKKKLYKTIPFLLLGLTLLYLYTEFYAETGGGENPRTIFEQSYLERYLLSNPTEPSGDLPRFQRVTIMFRLMRDDVGLLLFGMGYGLFGGGNILDAPRIMRSLHYLSGSKILLFTVWIQGGLTAVVVFTGAMFSFMRSKPISHHTIKRFNWFVFLSLVGMWFYNDAILDRTFAAITSFLMMWISSGGIEQATEDMPIEPAVELAEAVISR